VAGQTRRARTARCRRERQLVRAQATARLHGGKWGSEREDVQEGRLSRTARYHEVCAADKDGNDGGGGSEYREQWWVLPESVY
jgi:hypothetical protein